MTIPTLVNASVGRPITRLGISLFPVYLPGNHLPKIATGPDSGLVIDELPAAQVPQLVVINPTDTPVLVVEGEQFVGGAQNRTANVSVLVPAGAKVEIPVSCLEQGRWGAYRDFEYGRTFSHRRVRRAKQHSVAMSMAMAGSRSSDQGAVWGAIENEITNMDLDAPTHAMADADQAFERDWDRSAVAEELCGLGPLPGQCGVVVTHGHRAVSAEVFGSPDLLAPHWNALVRSHLLERPTAGDRPSATAALKLLGRFAEAESVDSPGIGLGVELHVRTGRVTGQALTLDGSIVHTSLFRK